MTNKTRWVVSPRVTPEKRGGRCVPLINSGAGVVAPGAVGKQFDSYPGTGRGDRRKKK